MVSSSYGIFGSHSAAGGIKVKPWHKLQPANKDDDGITGNQQRIMCPARTHALADWSKRRDDAVEFSIILE